jgi:hypothetical protein
MTTSNKSGVNAPTMFDTETAPAMLTFVCDRPNDVFTVREDEYNANPEMFTPLLERWAAGSEYRALTAEEVAERKELATRPTRENTLENVGRIKDRKVFEGVYVEELGGWLPSTPNDAIMYNAFATMAIDGKTPDDGQIWSLMDKTIVYLTSEVILKIAVLAVQQQNALYAYEQQLKERVRVEDEYWLIDLEAGWPATFYTKQPK